jgi:hypothetical protein
LCLRSVIFKADLTNSLIYLRGIKLLGLLVSNIGNCVWSAKEWILMVYCVSI